MTKLGILFILTLLLCGCAHTIATTETIVFNGIDFTEYSRQGFLITPEKYLGEYEAVGLLSARIITEVTTKMPPNAVERVGKVITTKDGSRYIEKNVGAAYYYTKDINTKTLIDSFYVMASKMGANGVMNFRIDYSTMQNGEITMPTAEVSGFAIKRVLGVAKSHN